jgi:hypothetical protein
MIVAASPPPPNSARLAGQPEVPVAVDKHNHHHHDEQHDHGHSHSTHAKAREGRSLPRKKGRMARGWLALSAFQRLLIVVPGIGILWLATLWAMGWLG